MRFVNHMRLEFDARPENESFARVAVSAFTVPFNPTMDVLSDLRTAVSEAVTNAIVHAYDEKGGEIVLDAALRQDGVLMLSVRDFGCGIADIDRAMQPLLTNISLFLPPFQFLTTTILLCFMNLGFRSYRPFL